MDSEQVPLTQRTLPRTQGMRNIGIDHHKGLAVIEIRDEPALAEAKPPHLGQTSGRTRNEYFLILSFHHRIDSAS
ncbi:MAG: hypothetical protein JZU50_01320 [Desulfobulbaceae bacterium]|nr:hypothetical protein [Desulfobulbaceae bacterium]